MAPPDFGGSVNPISTKGADYAHQIILAPPDLPMALPLKSFFFKFFFYSTNFLLLQACFIAIEYIADLPLTISFQKHGDLPFSWPFCGRCVSSKIKYESLCRRLQPFEDANLKTKYHAWWFDYSNLREVSRPIVN